MAANDKGNGFRNPFAAERLGGFLPFFWYGMRSRDWLRLLRSGRGGITLNRLLNIAGVSLMAPPSSAMHYLSEALFARRAEAVEIVPPVFVLGHWRSGTTHLHNLLTRDPASAFPTTFECVFPGGFLVGERALGWLMKPFLPGRRPRDAVPMAPDAPFEDEFALAKLGLSSPYAALAFPRDGPPARSLLDLSELPAAEMRRWEDGFLWLMRRLQLAHPGRRLTLKSPPHTARIGMLLKLFPEARFVHISRHPYEVYPSTLRLWKIMNSRLGLQNPALDDCWLPDHVLDTLPAMYAAYERDTASLAPGQLAEIRYDRLVADPIGTLRSVYVQLGLGDFATVEMPVTTYLESLGAHEATAHRLPDEIRARIAARWSGYFDRFGYDS